MKKIFYLNANVIIRNKKTKYVYLIKIQYDKILEEKCDAKS